ncbi:protein tyrosine phosphatase family protein [Vibrio nitrifigilis]|uniref:Protein tyrosine phosphatase family protein n=1 Tax=Vibrio nitrifigilis TaxID=2789781 RepID=A0ABS0GL57_9VIBR|nr:protein tyrosine phosphatase family protein [Vibrio nitrifigilis]MBF9002944.1 protein tyrosine phosphatase family protein [Vibrio nitrifigilis]
MESIKNFVQLTSTVATGGQPKRHEFGQIAAAGYRYVINLGMPDHPQAIAEEDKVLASLDITYIHIPVRFDEPTKEQVRLFCNVMAALKDQKVFVHCIRNYRVAAFMYHYLSKVEKQDDEQAKSSMFKSWNLDAVWQDVMTWTASDIGLRQ